MANCAITPATIRSTRSLAACMQTAFIISSPATASSAARAAASLWRGAIRAPRSRASRATLPRDLRKAGALLWLRNTQGERGTLERGANTKQAAHDCGGQRSTQGAGATTTRWRGDAMSIIVLVIVALGVFCVGFFFGFITMALLAASREEPPSMPLPGGPLL